MLDLRQFLTEITSDDSWQMVDSLTLVNSVERTATFQLDEDQLKLTIDQKPIYCGPMVMNRSKVYMGASL